MKDTQQKQNKTYQNIISLSSLLQMTNSGFAPKN